MLAPFEKYSANECRDVLVTSAPREIKNLIIAGCFWAAAHLNAYCWPHASTALTSAPLSISSSKSVFHPR